jgi:Flp pilus assembly protein TadD
LLLANALFSSGDRINAAAALSVAASDDPNSITVRTAQINLMLASRDVSGAITAARAYQSANPGIAADLLLANTLIRSKEYSQAAAILTRSMSVSPDKRAVSLLAQIAVAIGDRKHAENLMSDWLDANQKDIAIRTQYATVLMQDGNKEKATAQFEQILRQDANNIAALNNLAWLLQKDDPKRAYALASDAFKVNPGAADVVDTLGWIKLHLRDVKGAIELLKRAHDLHPKDGEITYHLVLALDASGNRNSARGLLKALLDSGVKFDDIVDALKLSEAWR